MIDDLNIEKKYDVIVSNCVVNLSPKKEEVLKQVFKHLKDGGEFYFSDVYSSQRIPNELAQDPVLWGECLSGALYWNDFLNIAKKFKFYFFLYIATVTSPFNFFLQVSIK